MTEDMKTGYQMIFNGMVKLTKSINMEPEYRKAWNEFLKEYWPIVKEYGESMFTKGNTPESEAASDAWWEEYLGKSTALIEKYKDWKEKYNADIIRIFYMFIFEVIEFAGRRMEIELRTQAKQSRDKSQVDR